MVLDPSPPPLGPGKKSTSQEEFQMIPRFGIIMEEATFSEHCAKILSVMIMPDRLVNLSTSRGEQGDEYWNMDV